MASNDYWNLGDEEDEEAYTLAMCVLSDSIKFEVFNAITNLNILEIIKNSGPRAHLSVAEIVAKLPSNNPEVAAAAIGRLLDFLVSHSILTVSLSTLPEGKVERRYGLAPLCKYLTFDANGVTLSPLATSSVYTALKESCLFLKDAILEEKESFTKAHGMTMYEYIAKNPEFRKDFHKLMSNQSTLVMRKLLETYKGFEGLSSLVDVGGGNGTILNMILTKYPTINGINFDQPNIIQHAPSYTGVKHIGGDMFVNLPQGDAMFLKMVCHIFIDDDKCISILRNCYDALPEKYGKVIICENVLPSQTEMSCNMAENSVIRFDIVVMALTGGKLRTKEEFEVLAFAAGFKAFQVVCSAYNMKIMELLK